MGLGDGARFRRLTDDGKKEVPSARIEMVNNDEALLKMFFHARQNTLPRARAITPDAGHHCRSARAGRALNRSTRPNRPPNPNRPPLARLCPPSPSLPPTTLPPQATPPARAAPLRRQTRFPTQIGRGRARPSAATAGPPPQRPVVPITLSGACRKPVQAPKSPQSSPKQAACNPANCINFATLEAPCWGDGASK